MGTVRATDRVVSLDGLRGLAALWVLVGHTMLLTGFRVPLLSNADLGVDLFILLSGYLMVFQYQLRKDAEDWDRPTIWMAFWIRRFFRISPLYYAILIVALIVGPAIYEDRVLIDRFLGRELQLPERYMDGSATNALLHLSYAFGFLPQYAFRTPLPDWSLGLEMQFYAVFPFVVLLARRYGWLLAALTVAVIAPALALATSIAGIAFPMPAFLPLKMHLFIAGMLIAAGGSPRHLVLALVLAVVPIGGPQGVMHLFVREALTVGFFALIHWRSIPVVDRVSRFLGSTPLHWLGELSYGIYLVHLLVLTPVAALAIRWFGALPPPGLRFGIVFAVVAATGYTLAFVGYRLIERPGQTIGRRLLKMMGRSKTEYRSA